MIKVVHEESDKLRVRVVRGDNFVIVKVDMSRQENKNFLDDDGLTPIEQGYEVIDGLITKREYSVVNINEDSNGLNAYLVRRKINKKELGEDI